MVFWKKLGLELVAAVGLLRLVQQVVGRCGWSGLGAEVGLRVRGWRLLGGWE